MKYIRAFFDAVNDMIDAAPGVASRLVGRWTGW